MRRGLIFLAVISACLATGLAGAASQASIVARSTVRALAADGDQVAYVAAPTKVDCDRVFIWQRLSRATVQLGKQRRCVANAAPVTTVAVTGGRALWFTMLSGKVVEWQLWTASTTRRTPHRLGTVTRGFVNPVPLIVGAAGNNLLPYAVDTTVTTLRADGSTAFTWTAGSAVIALAAAGGRVAVAEQGGRVTVLDARGKIASVDLYASEVSAVSLRYEGPARSTRRDARVAPRRGRARVRDPRRRTPDDGGGKWGVWSDGKVVHVVRLPDGAQVATYAGSSAALAGNRLYVANGRTITVRTIR